MCTVSFLPIAAGFRLAMNRDEKRTRVTALPPEIFQIGERRAIYPREPGGGTWLAVNDAGLCLALINWHRIEREPEGSPESRGGIIPHLIAASDGRSVGRELRRVALRRVRPFRLLSIDSGRQTVTEWQWGTSALVARRHPWQIGHWFSSGYDEAKAENEREKICAESSSGSSGWLKRLHASHLPSRGPFSICMHRPDAATVSYSEVAVTARRITLRYQPGPPCKGRARITRSLKL
jgi:Transport and Golgi organisation 2